VDPAADEEDPRKGETTHPVVTDPALVPDPAVPGHPPSVTLTPPNPNLPDPAHESLPDPTHDPNPGLPPGPGLG
jgi:hypothetical protein